MRILENPRMVLRIHIVASNSFIVYNSIFLPFPTYMFSSAIIYILSCQSLKAFHFFKLRINPLLVKTEKQEA